MPDQLLKDLAAQGFALRPAALTPPQLDVLRGAVAADLSPADRPRTELAPEGERRRRGETFAIRHLLWERTGFARLLADGGLDTLAAAAIGGPARPIDATLFDKIPEANWRVAAHQDLVLPVERAPAAWSPQRRFGVSYVEPPIAVLHTLVALRIHLDDCGADNGALAVLPGSHLHRANEDDDPPPDAFVVCAARAGDVLLMKPLLVHRSSPARSPRHRRVLHVVYAPETAAPDPARDLEWKQAR
jgi:hypothetical protein